jgi:ribosomal protein S21
VVYVDSPVGRRGSAVARAIAEPGGSLDGAVTPFETQCERCGPMSEPRQRQHHEQPSVERKRATLAAHKKAQRRQRMSD